MKCVDHAGLVNAFFATRQHQKVILVFREGLGTNETRTNLILSTGRHDLRNWTETLSRRHSLYPFRSSLTRGTVSCDVTTRTYEEGQYCQRHRFDIKVQLRKERFALTSSNRDDNFPRNDSSPTSRSHPKMSSCRNHGRDVDESPLERVIKESTFRYSSQLRLVLLHFS